MRGFNQSYNHKSGKRLGRVSRRFSALTRFVAWLSLVDDVDAAFAANELVVTVTLAEALEAITDLHGFSLPKPTLKNAG